MSHYRVSTLPSQPLVNLGLIVPQPKSDGIQYARREFVAGGLLVREGAFIRLRWDVLRDGVLYRDLLNQFGLLTDTTRYLTVYVRDENWNWVRCNGRAVKPVQRWERFFPRGIEILVRGLEVLS
jgi:hypothetical protein